MKKKVLLIDPPYLDLYGGASSMVKPYFPLGLGYLASTLLKRGVAVKIEANLKLNDCHKRVMEVITDFQPHLIGLTAMTPVFPRASRLARAIRSRFDIPVAIGGHHVTFFKEEILQHHPEFDFVISGEGEDTLIELVLNLDSDDYSEINGLSWRRNGLPVTNPPRPLSAEIDRLPFPARELVNISDFSTHSHIAGGRSATILTSRGCPFGCLFCAAHLVDGKRYRAHSSNYVLSEIEELVNRYDTGYIFIQDDTFTLDRARTLEICSRLEISNFRIRFGCFSRADSIDHEIAAALKRAGFDNIIFGAESGSQAQLDRIGKKTDLERLREAVSLCSNMGMKTTASFIIGLPGDTPETIETTINFAIRLKPALVAFNLFVPFPGAAVFDRETHIPDSYNRWESYLTTGIPPFSFVPGMTPQELYTAALNGHRKFYLRPSQIYRIVKTIRSFSDIREYAVAAITALSD